VTPPSHRGYGSRLIERGLAQELNGEVHLDYEPAGVVCEIVMPATQGAGG
jgi:two-component sensor histidine kinase